MRSLAIILLLAALPASTRADEFDSLCSHPVQTVFASIAAPLNFDEFSAYEQTVATYQDPVVCTTGSCAFASLAPSVSSGSDAATASGSASGPLRGIMSDRPIRRILSRLRPRSLWMRLSSRRGCR